MNERVYRIFDAVLMILLDLILAVLNSYVFCMPLLVVIAALAMCLHILSISWFRMISSTLLTRV